MRDTHDAPGAVILGGVFPCLGAARSLAKQGIEVCILGSSTCVARFSRSVGRFAVWPRGMKDEGLADYLVGMAERCGVRGWVLFPSSDEQLRILAQHPSLLAQHYILTTPSWETVRFLYDKRLTVTLAREAGVPMPHIQVPGSADCLAAVDVEFPVVLKPAITPHFMRATNLKAYRANNRQDLHRLFEKMSRVIEPSEVMVQQFLPDPSRNLFSFAGYFRNGEPIVGLSVKRTRQLPRDFGRSSTFVEVVEVPELRELATRLLRALDYTGLAEVEFMWNSKEARYELLEVNARLFAWITLPAAAGIGLVYVAFADALGQQRVAGELRPGIRWVRLFTDVRAAAREILSGTLSLRQYLASLQGPTKFAFFTPTDLVPSLAAPFLMLLDRLFSLASNTKRSLASLAGFRRKGGSDRFN